MKRTFFSSMALASVLCCLATQAPAQTAPRAAELRRLQGWSATEIIGTRVRSADGDEIGEIEDLVFSADDRVVSAVVSVGGLLDVADKLVALPYADLRLSADNKTLAIPLTKAEIESAPSYKATPPPVGEGRPLVDPERAIPPSAETRREANDEAERVFAGDDPRVAEGIAENKKAYEDDEARSDKPRTE
jgi:hypothetical protein